MMKLKKRIIAILMVLSLWTIFQNVLLSENLQELIEKGNLTRIQQLVNREPGILKNKIWGNPPLFYAAILGKIKIGEFFIKKGLKANRITQSGDTPLGFAIEAETGALPFIKMLLKNGADLSYQTDLGESYLHVAAFHNKKKLVDFFLNKGIDINLVKKGNLTPLHIAAVVGNKEIVKLLIQKKADLNIKSSDGGTPLHFARAAENFKIANILKVNNAKEIKREFPIYRGKFLGVKKPGSIPLPFVPEIFQDIYRPHSAPAFSPDGTEVYWEAMFMWGRMDIHRIWYMKEKNGKWQAPKITQFSKYTSFTPTFSPDGKKLFYSSRRPIMTGSKPNTSVDLWYVERKSTNTEWSSPKHLKIPVSKDITRKTSPYFASDNTLYFYTFGSSGMFKSSFINGSYSKPESLGDLFNTNYVDSCKTRKYMFITSGKRKASPLELYISYHKRNGKWSKPIHMGNKLHQGTRATNGRILPGGKYMIFNRYMSYYWMDTSIIDELKPETLR